MENFHDFKTIKLMLQIVYYITRKSAKFLQKNPRYIVEYLFGWCSLEKDPQQEEFLQGRMLGNPYSSKEPGLGPLMREVDLYYMFFLNGGSCF